MHETLDAFERFIHAQHPDLPPLIKAALLHHQFETIHPFLEFFLDGVAETANQAFEAATRIVALFNQDRARIPKGSNSGSVLRLHHALQAHPFLTPRQAQIHTGMTVPTINTAFGTLQKIGIVREITGKKRGRVYAYTAFMDILGEGAQPLPR